MNGVIVGGWDFVWWAYGITWVMLGGYGISLFVRFRGGPQ